MKRTSLFKRATVVGVGVLVAAAVLAAAPAQGDLVGHWNLDETSGTTASDSSGNARHGTLVGETNPSSYPPSPGPQWDGGGVLGGAIALDGLNDRIHVASVPDLKYSGGDMTLSTWLYVDAGESTGRVISKPWNSSGRYNYVLMYDGTNTAVSFTLGNSNPSAPLNKGIYSPAYPSFREAWHHLAAVVDSSNNMTLYVDGVQAATGTNTITDWTGLDSNTPLALGTLYPYSSTWHDPSRTSFSVDGKMDDAAIWTDALDAAHVRSLFTVPTDLGLAYDVADMSNLWDIHDSEGEGLVDGRFWTFTTSLPGSTNPGDAYEHDSLFFLVLGDGTGVQTVPEPSALVLAALALLGLAFGRRRR